MSLIGLVFEAAGILLIVSGLTFTFGYIVGKKMLLKKLWVYQYQNSYSYVKEVKSFSTPPEKNESLNKRSDSVDHNKYYLNFYDETVLTSSMFKKGSKLSSRDLSLTPRMTRVIVALAA